MIVFDLRCAGGHVFEAWFGSGAAYAEQRAAGQVACPMCGSDEVEKAAMAPAVPAKSNRAPPPAAVKQLMAKLAAAQTEALRSSEWVGDAFGRRARAMHAGEEAHAPIHGQASLAEAKAMIDDGVSVAPLPFPVVPPEKVN